MRGAVSPEAPTKVKVAVSTVLPRENYVLEGIRMGKKKKFHSNLTHQENLVEFRQSMRNLKEIDKPRKPIAKSFTAIYDGPECPKCFKAIEKGQTVRYDNDGILVHTRHAVPDPVYHFCDRCFLTLPCECD